jgi:primary-amine oxidase
MHEEDDGLLWKHVEYRTGHNESRRKRRLVVSFIATVVNYEYLFYWYFMQDGTIQLELKLTGELSTNQLSAGEEDPPEWGTMVAPGVNAQTHQHCFCARLDMAVDGSNNSVSEVDIVSMPPGKDNPHNNAFKAVETVLKTEKDAIREANPASGRVWKVFNNDSINPITKEPVAYNLIPFTFGAAQPLLLTGQNSAVTKRGAFATKSLFVTPHRDDERFPAGEYTPQSTGGEGLPEWTKADRPVENTDIVLWHSFAVSHVPRPEDFPVMPCETTGFTLKAHGFFQGNPAIDLKPDSNKKSECCSHDD